MADRPSDTALASATRFDIDLIMLVSSRRSEVRWASGKDRIALPRPGAGAHSGLYEHKYIITPAIGQAGECPGRRAAIQASRHARRFGGLEGRTRGFQECIKEPTVNSDGGSGGLGES
jgi:hypothetical protein